MYNINIADRDIILYFKHTLCDAHQKKGKLFGFDQLDDEICLMVKGFQSEDITFKGKDGENILEKQGCLYIMSYFFLKRITTHLKNYTFHQSINMTKVLLIHYHLGKKY